MIVESYENESTDIDEFHLTTILPFIEEEESTTTMIESTITSTSIQDHSSRDHDQSKTTTHQSFIIHI